MWTTFSSQSGLICTFVGLIKGHQAFHFLFTTRHVFLCVTLSWNLLCRLSLEIWDPPTSTETKGMFWVREIYQLMNLWLGSCDLPALFLKYIPSFHFICKCSCSHLHLIAKEPRMKSKEKSIFLQINKKETKQITCDTAKQNTGTRQNFKKATESNGILTS